MLGLQRLGPLFFLSPFSFEPSRYAPPAKLTGGRFRFFVMALGFGFKPSGLLASQLSSLLA